MNLYKKIFKEINNAGIKYMIVGGVAVNLYGYSRFTSDIDIIVLTEEQNLQKLDNLMQKLNFQARQPVSIQVLNDKENIKNLIKEKNFIAYTYLSKNNTPIDIDVLTNESLNFSEFEKRLTIINIWDLDLPVIGIDDLIDLKRKTNRQKDLEDLEALLKFKNEQQ
jgi:predicted nucleotidyltransferase